MPDRYLCPHCLGAFTVTKANKFRKHSGSDGSECMGTGELVPKHQLDKGPIGAGVRLDAPEEGRDIGTCETCGSKVKLTADGLYAEHKRPILGYRCPESGQPYEPPAKEERCPSNAASDAPAQCAPMASTTSPTSTTSTPSPFLQPGVSSTPAVRMDGSAPAKAETIPAAASPFMQPPSKASDADPVQPMTVLGEQVAAGLRQMFFHYQQRKTSDNRSAQTHMGPSEIGTPCDRRIALSLLGVPAVNPGGDGWAAFVGTCVHVGLADMFQWADGGSGRYATELPLKFPNVFIPRGTGDLLDRTLCMFDDHKLMGQFSLKKLRSKGPSQTYRVQVHTYGYGARLAGEKVDNVAIIGWPRDQSSLDDLYVWVEPYDATVALDAFKRVDDIAAALPQVNAGHQPLADWEKLAAAKAFPITPDCTYCPFYAPGDQAGERGCNGRQ